MSISERKLLINKYWVDVYGKRYLQVEEVKNDLFHQKNEDD